MTKVRVWRGYWTPEDVRAHPHALFVFGDNLIRTGTKGQASIRAAGPNVVGWITKKLPQLTAASFLSDMELDSNAQLFDSCTAEILRLAPQYDVIYFPEDGLGTGLTQLEVRAPRTWDLMQLKLQALLHQL